MEGEYNSTILSQEIIMFLGRSILSSATTFGILALLFFIAPSALRSLFHMNADLIIWFAGLFADDTSARVEIFLRGNNVETMLVFAEVNLVVTLTFTMLMGG
jgi:hypothetical protein